MTYIRHWLLSFGGTLCAGNDIWANNIRMFSTNESYWLHSGIMNPAGALEDVVADVKTHIQRPNSGYSNDARLTWVKFNQIDANGRYSDPSQTHAVYLEPAQQVVGSATFNNAPQVALAVSFATSAERGRASKGRVFIPRPAATADQTGRISAGVTAAIANDWAAFIRDLNNWPGIDYPASPVVGVVSNIGNPGQARAVTRVRVGNVLDTQRRRRNALDEAYSAAAV